MSEFELRPGDVLKAPVLLVFSHYGIFLGHDVVSGPRVLTVGPGYKTPVIQDLTSFSKGGYVSVVTHEGQHPRNVVLQRANNAQNCPHEYNLFANNCEHFCKKIIGVPQHSPQVWCGIAFSAIMFLAFITKGRVA